MWWSAVYHISDLGGGSASEAVPCGQGGWNTGLQCTQVKEFWKNFVSLSPLLVYSS